MIKLEISHIIIFALVALVAWIAQGKLAAMRKIRRLEKENSALRSVASAQDEALRRVAAINRSLMSEEKRPTLIIKEGHGYVKRL